MNSLFTYLHCLWTIKKKKRRRWPPNPNKHETFQKLNAYSKPSILCKETEPKKKKVAADKQETFQKLNAYSKPFILCKETE